jgi:hypothetical protein
MARTYAPFKILAKELDDIGGLKNTLRLLKIGVNGCEGNIQSMRKRTIYPSVPLGTIHPMGVGLPNRAGPLPLTAHFAYLAIALGLLV